MSNELDRMIKVMKASSIEAYDLLSIVYGVPDFFKKCKRQGSIQLDCSKCPIREKCSVMHEGKDVSKKECAEAIEAYVMDKKLVLPVPLELHEKLLEMGFQKLDVYVALLEEIRSCYVLKENNVILLLCPKAYDWWVLFKTSELDYGKTLPNLSALKEFFESAKAHCMETTECQLQWVDDNDMKKISKLLKYGDDFLKGLESVKRSWDGQKIKQNS